jgi:hypothetical protein
LSSPMTILRNANWLNSKYKRPTACWNFGGDAIGLPPEALVWYSFGVGR